MGPDPFRYESPLFDGVQKVVDLETKLEARLVNLARYRLFCYSFWKKPVLLL